MYIIILAKYPTTAREQSTQYSEAEAPQTAFANGQGDPPGSARMLAKGKARILRQRHLSPTFRSGRGDPPLHREYQNACKTKGKARIMRQRHLSHTFRSGRGDPLHREYQNVCKTKGKARILGQRHLSSTFRSGRGDPPPRRHQNVKPEEKLGF